jgi:hypothetical protein
MRTVLAAALLAAALAGPAFGGDPRPPITLDPAGATRLLSLVNAVRAQRGLVPLVRDPQLEAVAVRHTMRMASTGVLAHNEALFTRESHQALGIGAFAENVGYDWSVPGAHDGFMTSPKHLDNLLGPGYRLAGFAVARDAAGAVWVTEDFGTARTAVAAPAPAPATPAPRRAPAAAPPPRRPAARPAPPRPAAVPSPAPVAPRILPAVRDTAPDPGPVAPVTVPVAARSSGPRAADSGLVYLLVTAPLLAVLRRAC